MKQHSNTTFHQAHSCFGVKLHVCLSLNDRKDARGMPLRTFPDRSQVASICRTCPPHMLCSSSHRSQKHHNKLRTCTTRSFQMLLHSGCQSALGSPLPLHSGKPLDSRRRTKRSVLFLTCQHNSRSSAVHGPVPLLRTVPALGNAMCGGQHYAWILNCISTHAEAWQARRNGHLTLLSMAGRRNALQSSVSH